MPRKKTNKTRTEKKKRPASKDAASSAKKTSVKPKNKSEKKEPTPKRGKLLRFARFCLLISVWSAIALIILLIYYTLDLPSTDKLTEQTESHSIRILGANGQVIDTIGSTYGQELEFNDFPQELLAAVIATEDRRFFEHFAIDPMGLARAMFVNLKSGRVVQGGSTLTQQLAKVVFLSPDRTLKRKVQELLLAMWIEMKFTKEQIISMYLNRVYLGGGYYGMDAAAHGYFGKSAQWLTLGESAMLAGLLKAPSRYSPYNDPEETQQRTAIVLNNMVAAELISQKEAETARFTPIIHTKKTNKANYFVEWVSNRVSDYVGIVDQDLTVITTLEPKLQEYASNAVRHQLELEGERAKAGQAALVAMAPDGAILSMAGGKSFQESQYNRAIQAQRQPGSAFKFFVYLTAMEQGYKPSDTFVDEEIFIETYDGEWSPQNYYEDFRGEMTLKTAFAHSINTVAAQLIMDVGIKHVIELAQRLGVTSPLGEHASLSLGTSEVNLLEMTQAYAHVANGGSSIRAYGIKEILSESGEMLYIRPMPFYDRVIDKKTVRKMNVLLKAVTEHGGTAMRAHLDRDTAGKTGTSQNFRDAWFVGFTPQITAGVWVGNDDNSPMNHVTGGGLPVRIWKRFMTQAHEGLPKKRIPTGSGFFNFLGKDEAPVNLEAERQDFWDSVIDSIDEKPVR
jgi:penicillin-binding protein 1A